MPMSFVIFRQPMNQTKSRVAMLAMVAGVNFLGGAQQVDIAQLDTSDLTSKSLEELMQIPVTTVSRREERLSQAPAAIHVITQDDIRRSGVTSIPEALRMAPGVHVAKVDAHSWAISSRGFNDTFANKLLVMIDGRSVYTPLFSGVFWDVQDTILEDIERIEVVRGPGASLWGANAVNGVINIITKKASETQGGLVTAGFGTEEQGFGSFRYGQKIKEDLYARVYGKIYNRDSSALPWSGTADDRSQMARGGFRLDWEPSGDTTFTFQGDVYGGESEQRFFRAQPIDPRTLFLPPALVPLAPLPVPFLALTYGQEDRVRTSGGNLLGRWTRDFSEDSQLSVQTYYDHTLRETVMFEEERHTFDVDAQHRFALGDRNTIVYGVGYRMSSDDIGLNTLDITMSPAERTTHLFSAFVQDEIKIIENLLSLTIGTKLEHNDFTGAELQPSGRLLWTPHRQHTVWASVARAVRTPSRSEDDVTLLQGADGRSGSISPLLGFFGNRNFQSETLMAYELGYRFIPVEKLSFDLASFYNDYDDLRSAELGAPRATPGPPQVPIFIENKLEGQTYGGEIAANWQMLSNLRWRASYSLLEMQLHPKNGGSDIGSEQGLEGNDPHHQAQLRGSLDLPFNLELDAWFRYVDKLATRGVSDYSTIDLRLGWRPSKNVEVSIVGQNLLDDQHPEFSPTTIRTQFTEVERSVYGKITWRF